MTSKKLAKYKGMKVSDLTTGDMKILGLQSGDKARSKGEIDTIIAVVGLIDDRTDKAKRKGTLEFAKKAVVPKEPTKEPVPKK